MSVLPSPEFVQTNIAEVRRLAKQALEQNSRAKEISVVVNPSFLDSICAMRKLLVVKETATEIMWGAERDVRVIVFCDNTQVRIRLIGALGVNGDLSARMYPVLMPKTIE